MAKFVQMMEQQWRFHRKSSAMKPWIKLQYTKTLNNSIKDLVVKIFVLLQRKSFEIKIKNLKPISGAYEYNE